MLHKQKKKTTETRINAWTTKSRHDLIDTRDAHDVDDVHSVPVVHVAHVVHDDNNNDHTHSHDFCLCVGFCFCFCCDSDSDCDCDCGQYHQCVQGCDLCDFDFAPDLDFGFDLDESGYEWGVVTREAVVLGVAVTVMVTVTVTMNGYFQEWLLRSRAWWWYV